MLISRIISTSCWGVEIETQWIPCKSDRHLLLRCDLCFTKHSPFDTHHLLCHCANLSYLCSSIRSKYEWKTKILRTFLFLFHKSITTWNFIVSRSMCVWILTIVFFLFRNHCSIVQSTEWFGVVHYWRNIVQLLPKKNIVFCELISMSSPQTHHHSKIHHFEHSQYSFIHSTSNLWLPYLIIQLCWSQINLFYDLQCCSSIQCVPSPIFHMLSFKACFLN